MNIVHFGIRASKCSLKLCKGYKEREKFSIGTCKLRIFADMHKNELDI
jgi:hypothetical protein